MSRGDNFPMLKKARANSNSTITSLLTSQNTTQQVTGHHFASGSDSGEYLPIFTPEISSIMRGFGDCEHPLRESVVLVEKIVYQQMRGILQEAIDCAVARKGIACPSQKDFEFLMRRQPVKIFRLQKHLRYMKQYQRYQDIKEGRVSALQKEVEASPGSNSEDDSDRDVPERFDEEKTRRIFRADRISQMLNGDQYEYFHAARRTSFYGNNSVTMMTKFRSWLNIPAEVQITAEVLKILAYLVHETIAVLVDYCILTRLNSSNRITEPYSRVTSGSTYGMIHLCPDITQGRGADGVKPITVQEINEAMRRHNLMSSKPMGLFRNVRTGTNYLAI
ncbi:uncharacterized protein LOC132258292 [Phlebotomus argentipes]|uniref:uncharacterized protein LOC132258292 n=1 Tax=Phlebotomus argentipes TaxID=94469 RepID=UPI0028937724|nr:uncharacterized protein LOC132258292 [Phlebotomus argentipes]